MTRFDRKMANVGLVILVVALLFMAAYASDISFDKKNWHCCWREPFWRYGVAQHDTRTITRIAR